MAGEVTRRQQKLQVVAEDPLCFFCARIYGVGREKANDETDISKFYSSSKVTEKTTAAASKVSLWTKVEWKAKDGRKDGQMTTNQR